MKDIKLFVRGRLDDVLRDIIQQMKDKINNEEESYLLNVNEKEYLDHLQSEFSIDPPIIDFGGKFADATEKMIPASQHPSGLFFIDEDKEYKRQIIIYHLPFSGDVGILNFMPNPSILWSRDILHETIEGTEVLSFEVVNFSQDPKEVKRIAEGEIGSLKTQVGHITKQVDQHNSELGSQIEEAFNARKKDLMTKSDFLTQLGVPIRKREDVPQTFAVPAPQTPKKIIPKPATVGKGGMDPTIDIAIYNDILQIIHDVGKAIERMPSTYKGKTEEELRDHLLINLEPRFEGSATGETFNKTGKTDILLRYQSSNVFVAECKFWSGESGYLDTIDQILGYLTWRDSKAAIVLFVRNKEFSSVIETVKSSTLKHANFLSFESEKESTWLTYKIHLVGDKGRAVYLTVLLFHFPDLEN